MVAGRPTILAIDGEIRKVIEAANGGIFVPPGDEKKLARAILRLYNDQDLRLAQGKAARKYVETHFNCRNQYYLLEKTFEEVTNE